MFNLTTTFTPQGDQPEAYIPSTDTFIDKDASRNELIDRLRLSSNNLLRNLPEKTDLFY